MVMKNAFSLGKIAGIQVYIHWTFPIIIFWIIFSNLSKGLHTEQIVWSVIFTLTVFVCVVLHEFGHALAARHYHFHTIDITLYPIGGVARLEKMPDKPLQELVVALAGPAVNFIILTIMLLFFSLSRMPLDFATLTYVNADNFLFSLALVNLWLAVFNLIPAFPMDGGRVLRALLSFRLDRVVATRIAAGVGQSIAVLFVIFGFFSNPFLIFIGLFVFLGATAEAEMVKNESVLKGRTTAALAMKEMPILKTSDTVNTAVEILLNGQCKNFLVYDGDIPAGTLDRDGIIRALQQWGGEVPILQVMEKNLGYIDAGEPAEKALLMMQQNKFPLLIVTKNNQVIGTVDLENIMEFMMVINARNETPAK